jgi:hypothetical protein
MTKSKALSILSDAIQIYGDSSTPDVRKEADEALDFIAREKPEEHNGWSNYATWRVNLECLDGIQWSPDEMTFEDIASLKEYLKDTVETIVFGDEGGDTTSLAFGYAHAFIEDVNYHEIATHVAEAYPSLITGTNTQEGEKI